MYLPLLEETGYMPKERYSFAPEIFAHAQRIGKHFDLYKRACFQTQLLRCTIAQDAGRAIHPSYVEGQMQGGTAQGLGWGLNEEYVYDANGRLRNFGLLDYRMPTCLDMPLIETIIVEVLNPLHPLGIRGVGEVSIVPPPAAAANAVYRASGIRMTELPIAPPRLLRRILQQRARLESQAAAAD